MPNLKKTIAVSALSAMVAVTALTGCQSTSSTGDRTAGRVLDDKNITAQVREKLSETPVYKFSDVNVNTFEGVVQLSGFVTTQEQKQQAVELARQVNGVRRVVDSLTLKPQNEMSPTGRSAGGSYQDNQSNQQSPSGEPNQQNQSNGQSQ